MASSINAYLPSLDPNVPYILEKLDGLIGSSGSIRSAQEVPKLISLMKDISSPPSSNTEHTSSSNNTSSTCLIHRCILLNTLHATRAHSTLSKFMEGGGWSLLNVWLSDAKKSQNIPLIIEILQVLQKLPVGIAALKQGNLGKLVKQLSKHDSSEVKALAGEILSKWMTVFKVGQAARGKTTPSGDKLEGGPVSDLQQTEETLQAKRDKEREKKAAKRMKKDLSAVESQAPLGPLVALGKPRDKLSKRPRDLVFNNSSVPLPQKKAKTSPPILGTEDEDKPQQKNEKGLMESNIFMDALSTQAAKWQEKRIKKINKAGARSSPTVTKAPVDIDNVSIDTPSPVPSTDSAPPTLTNGLGEESMEQDTPTNKVAKKRVTWAEESSLVSVHYFEMDESERVNVNKGKSFLDAAQREKLMEKEALSTRMYDQLMEVIQWYRPLLMDYSSELVVIRGKDSHEVQVQAEREQTVLAQLFLSKSSVLPTPSEPDPEQSEEMEVKIKNIPLQEPGAVHQPPPPPFNGGGNMYPHAAATSPQGNRQDVPPYNNNYMGNPPHPGPDPNMRGPPEPYGGNGSYGYGAPPPPHPDYQYYSEPNGSVPYHHHSGRDYPRGRGRGRGRFRGPPAGGNICKHFATHGCRLGNNCKFLHVLPDDVNHSPSKKDVSEQRHLKNQENNPVLSSSPPSSSSPHRTKD